MSKFYGLVAQSYVGVTFQTFYGCPKIVNNVEGGISRFQLQLNVIRCQVQYQQRHVHRMLCSNVSSVVLFTQFVLYCTTIIMMFTC